MSYRQQGYRPQTRPPQQVGNGRYVNHQDAYAPQINYRSAQNIKKRNGKRKGRPFFIFLLLVVFALLATAGVMGYQMYDEIDRVERANTFYPGVFIDDIQLYGHAPQEVYDYLTQKTKDELSNFTLELVYGDHQWYITRETLGMTDTVIDTIVGTEVNKAFAVGRDKSLSMLERYRVIKDLKTNPYHAYITGIEKNMYQIDAMIAEIRQAVYVEPVDAKQMLDSSRKNALVTINEEEGLDIDEVLLKNTIEQMVNNMESGVFQVPTKSIPANVTADVLNGQMVQIAYAVTPINRRSTPERNKNVERGCEPFNGMTVQAGQVVSFNNVVGLRTKKNGFYEAQEIVGDEYKLGVGGGICQVSTTLYQAVIQAGLEVIERENHAIPVNYTDKGADATVYDGRIDFKFKNNTEAPIYIVAKVVSSSSGLTCEFQIFGRPIPNNYRYKMRHEEEIIPIPDKVEKVVDTEQTYVLYTDQKFEVPGKEGYKVYTYLQTYTADGAFVEEKHITTDIYKPTPNKLYVGVERR